MANEEIYRLIDDYLNNRLSEEERTAFEKRCLEDEDFAAEVKLHTRAEIAVRTLHREERKKAFNEEFDRLSQRGEVRRFPPRTMWMGIAASVIILLGLVWLLRPKPAVLTGENLFAENIGNIDPLTPYRTQDSIPQSWSQAARAFNQGDFDTAIQMITATLEDTAFQNRSQANLYLGISYMLLIENDPANLEPAIRAFDLVEENSSSYQKALWYKALAYLRGGQFENSRRALEAVSNYSGHYRQSRADSLIQLLE